MEVSFSFSSISTPMPTFFNPGRATEVRALLSLSEPSVAFCARAATSASVVTFTFSKRRPSTISTSLEDSLAQADEERRRRVQIAMVVVLMMLLLLLLLGVKTAGEDRAPVF